LADARKRAHDTKHGLVDLDRTVQEAYDDWVAHIRRTRKSPLQVEQRMGKHFTPEFGQQKLSGNNPRIFGDLLSTVAATAPVQANRLLGDLKAFFGYCVERGWIPESPVAAITKRTVGGAEKPRDRVLTQDELREVISELRTTRFAPLTRLGLALCLLTGQRSGEVRGISRREVAGTVWTLPAARTKNGKPHTVYLGPTARRLLRWAFKEFGDSPMGAMPNQVLSRATNRMKLEPTFTPHDLRRTMATVMAEGGVPPHVVERCLNHTMPGVAAVYNRAKYAAECRAAWRQWERELLAARKKPPA
jgi:integrase